MSEMSSSTPDTQPDSNPTDGTDPTPDSGTSVQTSSEPYEVASSTNDSAILGGDSDSSGSPYVGSPI
jgi:hypothetical protein